MWGMTVRYIPKDVNLYCNTTFHGVILPTRFDIASCCFLFFAPHVAGIPSEVSDRRCEAPTFNSKHGNFKKMSWNLWIEHD